MIFCFFNSSAAREINDCGFTDKICVIPPFDRWLFIKLTEFSRICQKKQVDYYAVKEIQPKSIIPKLVYITKVVYIHSILLLGFYNGGSCGALLHYNA